MPYYKALFKTRADDDGRTWPLGPHRTRDDALAFFNGHDAKIDNIGPFTFEETSPVLPKYCLAEQEVLNGEEVLHSLYNVRG